MTRTRSARLLLIAPALIILYLLLFPYPLGRELVVVPRWVVSLPPGQDSTLPAVDEPGPAAPGAGAEGPATGAASFRLGDTFGYVSPAGRLMHVERVHYQVTLSSSGYVNYGRLDTDWILYGPGGESRGAYASNGYPMLSDDGSRLMVIKTDLSGLQELAPTGEMLWSRDFPALITSASIVSDRAALGLLSGSLVVLDRRGSLILDYRPGPSRIPVILGVAVSRDGAFLAAVSGIDPQLLTVLHRSGATYSVLDRQTLPTDFRREVRIAFSPNARLLLLEGNGAVGAYEPASRRLTWVTQSAPVQDILFLGQENAVALLVGTASGSELALSQPPGPPLLRLSLPAGSSLAAVDGQLLLGVPALPQGTPAQLLRLDLEQR